jgi:hypothetical protein
MARKKPGPYAPLSAHYADDDRIMAAGEEAELLYLRALAYCARTPKTEGHLTFAQVKTRLGLDGAESRAETCAEVGLLTRTDSGYQITSWLKWNLSAEEVERVRTQDRNRKADTPTSADTGKRSGNGSGKQGGKQTGIPVPYTETDTETETGSLPRKRGQRIPQPFIIDEPMREWVAQQGWDPSWVLKHTQRFENHFIAKTGRDATKLDWRATWRNWLLKEADDRRPPSSNDEHAERYMQRLADMERKPA